MVDKRYIIEFDPATYDASGDAIPEKLFSHLQSVGVSIVRYKKEKGEIIVTTTPERVPELKNLEGILLVEEDVKHEPARARDEQVHKVRYDAAKYPAKGDEIAIPLRAKLLKIPGMTLGVHNPKRRYIQVYCNPEACKEIEAIEGVISVTKDVTYGQEQIPDS